MIWHTRRCEKKGRVKSRISWLINSKQRVGKLGSSELLQLGNGPRWSSMWLLDETRRRYIKTEGVQNLLIHFHLSDHVSSVEILVFCRSNTFSSEVSLEFSGIGEFDKSLIRTYESPFGYLQAHCTIYVTRMSPKQNNNGINLHQ